MKNKIAAAALLFLVMGLVIVGNHSTRSKSTEINDAVNSIYRDRLIVESYIFSYSQKFREINEIIDSKVHDPDRQQTEITRILMEAKSLNEAYVKTRLTAAESVSFQKFAEQCDDILHQVRMGDLLHVKQSTNEASDILQVLSTIQVTEAAQQMKSIHHLFNSSDLYSQFEIAMLVVICVVIQALIFAGKTLRSGADARPAILN